MQTLNHPNIVRLYSYCWIQSRTEYLLVMVLEPCDKDLGKDCKQRLANSFPYQEVELWGIARELVRVLAWLQGQNIAHRDIKPENIFLTQSTIKLGDFGTSRQMIADTRMSTVTGTPLYLSPQLRKALYSQSSQTSHNAYKSDVYSLGMTLLVLAILNPVQVLNSSEEKLAIVLAGIPYSEQFKSMVGWMIVNKEENRPDFFQLQQYFESLEAVQSSEIPSQSQHYSQVDNPSNPYAPHQSYSQATPKASERQSHPTASNPPASQVPIPAKATEEEKVMHSRPPRDRQSAAPPLPPRSHSPNSFDLRPRTMPQDPPINCMSCGKDFLRSSLPVNTVQLVCDPYAHICCSPRCFQTLLRIPNPHCLICNFPIDQETVTFYGCPETPGSKCSNYMKWVIILCLGLLMALFQLLFQLLRLSYTKTVQVGSDLLSKRK